MSRQRYKYYSTTGLGGINQQAELANPKTELADARNIWAPNGRIESRFGYTGVNTIDGGASAGTAYNVVIKYTGGIYTTYSFPAVADLSNMAVGDYVYFGLTDKPSDYGCIIIAVQNFNSNITIPEFGYWNGTSWVYLPGTAISGGLFMKADPFVASVAHYIAHQGQTDWTIREFQGQTKYFVRAFLDNEGTDATTSILLVDQEEYSDVRGIFSAQFSSIKKYYSVCIVSSTVTHFKRYDSINKYREYLLQRSSLDVSLGIPPTIAVVSEFDEAFIAYNGFITRHTPEASTAATVENRDFAVGDKAPYDPNYIQALGMFPEADYVEYFANRLWFAGIKNDPFGIRWGAPAPYHKVLPALSREVLVEDDNSSITAIHPLGEQMVAFKQDSIWIMVDIGVDEFDLRQYVPKRVVAGVGCVVNSSVQKIRGNLIFLAEDGIYAFDGTPDIKKLSDRIQKTVDLIDVGQRPFVSSVNWKKYSLYLLAVSTDGAQNNDTVFAWDYKNNSWWIWNNIDARNFMKDEDASDNEIVYFGDQKGRIYQLDYGITDNGSAISAYYITERFGRKEDNRKMLRYAELEATNKSGTGVTIEPLVNDGTAGTSGITGTADFTDSNDVGYERRRQTRIGFRREFDWIQTKVSHSTKNSKFKASKLSLAYFKKGIR